ncbi:hypothetical protein DFP72DRAFT_1022703 [Ephemerocybe angulata]|uniref:Ubiquitin-like protease family profile domain-containing protein n=1 Tax=Ephemerocybe angulata TaxID=980116 RepID=A0A8H6H9U7_9AGAR|nr:hypothetical protein DFP72DRAFT_1022703 [Tulosesus angulatus]
MSREETTDKQLQERANAAAWLASVALRFDDGTPLETADLVEECRENLHRLPLDGTAIAGLTPHHTLNHSQLTSLLGDHWLDDSTILAGTQYILYNAANPSITAADTFLLSWLKNLSSRSEGREYEPVNELDRSIQSRIVTQVYMPLHVFGNHWSLFHLDLAARTWSYADCFHGHLSPPSDQLDLIIWWLKGLGVNFEEFSSTPLANNLPRQLDAFSCGIIVLSLMASRLLHHTTWSPARAAVDRMLWFLRLTSPPSDGDDSDSDDDDDYPGFLACTRSAADDPASCSPPPPPSPSQPPSTTGSSPPPVSVSEPSVLGKRHASTAPTTRAPTANDSDDDSCYSDSVEGARYRRKARMGPRDGSSWALQRELRKHSKDKGFRTHSMKLRNFQEKILSIDPNAEFKESDACAVRCSACAKWLQMRLLYDTRRFSEHRRGGKCRSTQAKGSITKSLLSMGFVRTKKDLDTSQLCMSPLPCPGLTREAEPKVEAYICRTSATYGGAPSRMSIARTLFDIIDLKVLWSDLNAKQQRMVLRREVTLAAWRIVREVEAVFSVKCDITVYTAIGKDPSPCHSCKSLLELHSFQVALRRPQPSEANMKYVPKAHRCTQLGEIYLKYHGVRELLEKDDGRSPWLRFAIGATSGEYQCETLLGMVEAFVVKSRRLQQGKSLRNIQYSSAFSDFCNVLASLAPVGYRTFREQFGGRTVDGMRKLRAKQPKFHPGFSPVNAATAADILLRYNYRGPIALSWDDTDLEPGVSVFQESKDVCLVVGGVNGVVRVTSEDDLDSVFTNAQLKQATKLRLWILTVPLPKVPPIIVAAVARDPSSSALELQTMHDNLVSLLHSHGIYPVSGSSDGTETERALQSLIVDAAGATRSYIIPNSHLGTPAHITLTIPLVDSSHPFIPVQDSKHALKTARNQILTGARLLTLGDDVLHFHQLRSIAHAGGALLVRDVDRLDRQDDRAAARVFSAAMLDDLLDRFPQQRALAIYLFVLGELVDAWQNRRISHLSRAKMVMRARFFLTAWRTHIVSHPEHNVNTHFISRESFDIFLTLCDSLLSLIIVYRMYYANYPLLPWLHSTESCEHAFGSLRRIKEDFTYGDMLAAVRKVDILMAGAFRDMTAEQKANVGAAGYCHTYFEVRDIDLRELSRFPTDQEFGLASDAAFLEVSPLLELVGISLRDMLTKYVPPPRQLAIRQQVVSPQEASLSSLLALYDNTWRTNEERTVRTYQYALAADSAARSQELAELPELSDDHITGIQTLLSALPFGVEMPDKSSSIGSSPPSSTTTTPVAAVFVVDNTLQRDALVAQRIDHQTEFAMKAVRKTGSASILMGMNPRTLQRFCEQGPSLRETLISKLKGLANEAQRRIEQQQSSSGLTRQIRLTGTFAGGATTTQEQSKATVKAVNANRFLQLRDQVLAPYRGVVHENLSTANINPINVLSTGHLVIALSPLAGSVEVFLGEVIIMYSRGNGKNAKHDWVPQIDNLGLASYIYVLKYIPMAGHSVFTALACPQLASPSFIQVPRTHLLFSLALYDSIDRSQSISISGRRFGLITLCPNASSLFTALENRRHSLVQIVAEFKRLLAGNGGAQILPLQAQAATIAEVEENSESDSEP